MLRIENLTFTYNGQHEPALDGINLNIQPGKLVLLCGQSGSGKSTLMHCINGLSPNHYGGKINGHIWIGGREINDKSLLQISELVGTVFQNPNTQFFHLTVEDEIAFGLEHLLFDKNEITKRVNQALKDVEIEHLKFRDIFTLSSGEKQKVAIAAIIAMEQPLILMDEPTANLDIPSILDLRKLLIRLKQQGRTIIISEHRLWYLRNIADQTIIIKEGKIVYDGNPQVLNDTDFRQNNGLRIWDKLPKINQFFQEATLSQTILNVDNISAKAGKNTIILNDINIKLQASQSAAIMGSNGAGKTFLSRTIIGLNKEAKGSISIEANQLKAKNRIGKIGFVSQHADQQLFSDTVIGELLITTIASAEDIIDAQEILTKCDLDNLTNRHPQTLSAGQKQRLAIASSLAVDNKIIILDEPTSGMDYKRMKLLADEVNNLCRQGVLVIIITHDIELVSLCCQRIFWMEKGTITKIIEPSGYNELFTEQLKLDNKERQKDEMSDSIFK